MKIAGYKPAQIILLAVMLEACETSRAQTSWAAAANGNWNTAASWSPAVVPGVGTNASIIVAGTYTVTYNSAMSAGSIASLTLGSNTSIPTLTLTAAGFNVAGTTTFVDTSAEVINVNSGGVMTNGTLAMTSRNAVVNVNNGGILTNGTTQVANNNSVDGANILKINSGATANLGAVTIGRHTQSSSDGLIIAGGTVSASSIDVKIRNSYANMAVSGGTVTNAGSLRLGTGSAMAGREIRYSQTGGTVGCAGTVDLAVAGSYTVWFSVLNAGSTFYADGIRIFPNAVSSAVARLTNSGNMYLGAGGFKVLNTSSGSYTVTLNDQSVLGATADWAANVNMVAPSGTITFKAADAAGTAHNLTLTNPISGGASLTKSGGGTLTLLGANTYAGNTTVGAGLLVLGNASALPKATALTLGGSGSIGGPVTFQSGTSLKPTGIFTITGNLTLTSAKLFLDLANVTTPGGGGNDLISISGGSLTLSGVSTISPNYLNGALTNGTYTLISGGSSTTGSAANLAWSGPTGARQTVSLNMSTPGTVLLNVSGSLPASLVWQGTNGNNWDLTTTNWLNGNAADKFFNVDSVMFNDSSTNGSVTVISTVQSGSIIVSNTTTSYTLSGGNITGGSSLFKYGTGLLTVSSSNSFSGGTVINGGTIIFTNDVANVSGLGSGAITLNDGTLTMFDSAATANNAAWNLIVPASASGNLNADSRCNLSGSLTGGGTFNFNVTGTQTALLGDWSAFSGKINVTGGGEFRVLNFSGYPNAAINFSNNVTADFQGAVDPNGTTLAIGELSGISSSKLLGGFATNGEVLTWNIGGLNTDATFAGQIAEQNTNAITAINKTGTGTWTLTGSNTFSGGMTVSEGTLQVNNTNGSATGTNQVFVATSATLSGSGIIGGLTAFDDGAILAPGNGVGTLTINNELDLSDLTVLQFGLGTNSDKVVVSGNLVLGGQLNITNTGGFGTGTYTLFTYGGALTLGNLTVAAAPAGFICAISTSTSGQINLIVTRPQFNAVGSGTGGVVMSGSGGAPNGIYYVLSSTNIALPLNLWTRLATNQFDASGIFNFTNVLNPDTPENFYQLQLP